MNKSRNVPLFDFITLILFKLTFVAGHFLSEALLLKKQSLLF